MVIVQENAAPSVTGTVTGVRNQIATISFADKAPDIGTVLTAPTDTNETVVVEVLAAIDHTTVEGLILTQGEHLYRGAPLYNSFEVSQVPVGLSVLGRMINVLGKPEDGEAFSARTHRPIQTNRPRSLSDIQVPQDILETGIKAIDFFSPLFHGGKMGLFGGAGLGKTVLLTELINSIVVRGQKKQTAQHSNEDRSVRFSEQPHDARERVSVFTAVGERIREAHELHRNLAEAGVLQDTALVIGQMGENPALRFQTAAAGVALAEYFRDQEKKDVLFFMDNMYRFAQAGYEIATQRNLIPSEDGYQPHLPTQIGSLHERLTSSPNASITTIEAVYLPSDDITDYSVRSIMPYLDSIVVLSREVYKTGRLPAVDLLASSSSALRPEFISEEHFSAYEASRQLLEHAARLERIVSLVGMNELSPDNRVVYQRAKLLESYMTQPFSVVEQQSGIPGEYVPLEQTVRDVQAILEGKHDGKQPEDIQMKGALEA